MVYWEYFFQMAILKNEIIFATLVLISVVATSPTGTDLVTKDDSKELSSSNWSFYNVATLSTAVLVVSVGFAALVSLFFPVFVYKLCYLVGGCQDALDLYVDQLISEDKRSLEYIEPFFTTLVNAYEKYADDGIKKKFKKPKF